MKYNGGQQYVKDTDYPRVGEVVTAYVGEEMVSKGKIYEEGVLKVKATIDGWAYDIPAGTYPQVGFDDKNDFYSPNGDPGSVTKNPLADPFTGLSVKKALPNEVCVITVFSATACYKGNMVKERRLKESADYYQQTLLYSGRVGNKINIGYREFSGSTARPAFNNDVEYDLSASNQIGYKGALIEVLKADNSSITYRLIRNFR
jgi:hypothetical protein